jgi:hypothetical protein
MAVDGLIIFFNRIPFIDCDDDSLSTVMCDSRDLGILLGHALGSVDHNNTDICTLNGCHCTDNTVTLDLFFDLILTSQSCGIDKHIFFSIVLNISIDCISGCTCDIRYNDAVLLRQFIDEG